MQTLEKQKENLTPKSKGGNLCRQIGAMIDRFMNFLRGNSKGRITEKHVLKHFKRCAKIDGGLFFKISDRYMTGFPDVIYLCDGTTWFIELKKPGELPEPAQAKIGLRIQAAGGRWTFLDSKESVDAFFYKINLSRSKHSVE